MRLIDADALIDDLKHDVAADQDSLDYEELTDSNREMIQFDKTIEPQRWIPCSELLPEALQEVIVTSTAGYVYTSRIVHGDFEYGGNVIAWMPLPEAYREVTE